MAATVRPYTDKHGIKSVVFALELVGAISAETLVAIKDGDAGATLKKSLPRVQEQRSIVLNFPMAPSGFNPGVDQTTQPLTGLQYDLIKPDGSTEWAVSIQQSMILITCGNYERWKAISEKAREFLKTIVPYLGEIVVATVGLQYVDEFYSTVPKEQFKLSGLFSSTSRYIPQNIVGCNGPCHSHHGFFDTLEQPLARILNNINVNVLEETAAFRIEVVGAHRCMLRTQIGLNDIALLQPEGTIGAVWEKLHTHNKKIIGDMLIDEVKQAINFDVISEGNQYHAHQP